MRRQAELAGRLILQAAEPGGEKGVHVWERGEGVLHAGRCGAQEGVTGVGQHRPQRFEQGDAGQASGAEAKEGVGGGEHGEKGKGWEGGVGAMALAFGPNPKPLSPGGTGALTLALCTWR